MSWSTWGCSGATPEAAPDSAVDGASVLTDAGAVARSDVGFGCDFDADGDGEIDDRCVGGSDCNDGDALIGTSQPERCGDGRDNDCDGTPDETDCATVGGSCDSPVEITSSGTFLVQTSTATSGTGCRSPESLPGGDPASLVVAPVEQMRQRYVFLTPDRFAFDFVTVVAEVGTVIVLDGKTPEELGCTVSAIPAGGLALAAEYLALRCQLSYPEVALDGTLEPGLQGDGVHRIDADAPVGVSVYGFDRFISYAYPAGLDLDILR